MQARALLDHPDRVATTSRAGLVTDDLEVVRTGYRPTGLTTSALMFRADLVTSTLGWFDPVRRGADTEYELRIQAAFGRTALVHLDDVLALVRRRPTSLSGGDFRPGWRHRARQHYRQAYLDWHLSDTGSARPFLDPDQPRPFRRRAGCWRPSAPPSAATTCCWPATGSPSAGRNARCWRRSRRCGPTVVASPSPTSNRCGS